MIAAMVETIANRQVYNQTIINDARNDTSIESGQFNASQAV
jgi:hypothetical protein